MSEDEVKQAMELLDKGKTYDEVSYVVGVHSSTIIRKVRQYKIYGSSLFSKDPSPITSCACADTESFSNQSSPFSSWLFQQRSFQKQSSGS